MDLLNYMNLVVDLAPDASLFEYEDLAYSFFTLSDLSLKVSCLWPGDDQGEDGGEDGGTPPVPPVIVVPVEMPKVKDNVVVVQRNVTEGWEDKLQSTLIGYSIVDAIILLLLILVLVAFLLTSKKIKKAREDKEKLKEEDKVISQNIEVN